MPRSVRLDKNWSVMELQRDSAAHQGSGQEALVRLEGFGLHNHRHTFRRNFASTGATPEEQMWAMGHTNLPTTMDYGADGFDRTTILAPYAERVVSILEGKKAV